MRASKGMKVVLSFLVVIMIFLRTQFLYAQDIKPEHIQDTAPVHQYIC